MPSCFHLHHHRTLFNNHARWHLSSGRYGGSSCIFKHHRKYIYYRAYWHWSRFYPKADYSSPHRHNHILKPKKKRIITVSSTSCIGWRDAVEHFVLYGIFRVIHSVATFCGILYQTSISVCSVLTLRADLLVSQDGRHDGRIWQLLTISSAQISS